jgi:hypothetical protein
MEPGQMLSVVCVKWGHWCSPHGARYVNNLYRGVTRNLTLPHRFICFTDDPSGLDPEIEVRSLPTNLPSRWWLRAAHRFRPKFVRALFSSPYLLTGKGDNRAGIADDIQKTWWPIDLVKWWNKLYLFKPGVLSGRILFIDLDTVIVGNLDEIACYSGPFCILRDFHKQLLYGSGLMAWEGGVGAHIWEDFVMNGCPDVSRGDQMWIQRRMPDPDFFQDLYPGQCVSYKVHSVKNGPPKGARIICFHGEPRPHEVTHLPWMSAWDDERGSDHKGS